MMNIQKMMKQAQQMQQKMMQMQDELGAKEYEGNSGGGLVKVTVNGKGVMLKANIDGSLMVADEKEILEDLIVAAYNDAKNKADSAAGEEMNKLTGGMGLPADFKMPF
jgi:DNA-binding YbaB/EbfC family protein